VESGKWKVESGKWKVESEGWRVKGEEWKGVCFLRHIFHKKSISAL